MRVYGWRGSWKSVSIGPDSTISPAYMTAARSHTWATTGRSWVTRIIARPRSSGEPHQELEDLGLHHHVERGRRLVGEQHLRAAGERHRDRRPLAHAARELVRVAVGARARDPDQLEQLAHLRPRRPARTRCRAAPSARRSARRSVFTGLNAFIAPWNTIAMSRQRCGATVSSPFASMSSPSSSTRPATLALGGRSPISARIVVVLPQPDSPTRPIRSPGRRSKSTPWTACSSPPPRGRTRRAGPRPGGRAAAVTRSRASRAAAAARNRRTDRWPTRSRGLSASSIAWPIIVQARITSVTHTPGGMIAHQALLNTASPVKRVLDQPAPRDRATDRPGRGS